MDWSQYARVYDHMATNNPAYQALVALVRADLRGLGLVPGGVIADLGAGTGNFSLEVATLHPQCRVQHVDSSPAMLDHARSKASALGLSNVEFIESDVEAYLDRAPQLAAALSVHALYALPRPGGVIKKTQERLMSGSRFIACDLGRTLNLLDWWGYLFGEMRRRNGSLFAVSTTIRGRAVASHNRSIRSKQLSGEYWTHSTEEFAQAFRAQGFRVEKIESVYRGYSDYVVASKL